MAKTKTPKAKVELTPKTVSWLLIAGIGLLVAGTGLGSWYLQKQLSNGLVAADHAKIDAELSQTELQRSRTLETYFIQNRAAINKAADVVSDTKTYQYQDQIVRDIQVYATKANITIQAFNFPDSSSAVATTTDTTGLKSVTAALVFKTPLSYSDFLIFLKYVEQNITKMQIVDLTMSPKADEPQKLQAVSATLKVYVR